jgi:hypothetical protein
MNEWSLSKKLQAQYFNGMYEVVRFWNKIKQINNYFIFLVATISPISIHIWSVAFDIYLVVIDWQDLLYMGLGVFDIWIFLSSITNALKPLRFCATNLFFYPCAKWFSALYVIQMFNF